MEVFSDLPDARRGAGQRHQQALCLSLFTLAICTGCGGFIAIDGWLESYRAELLASYANSARPLTVLQHYQRVLPELAYKSYSAL